MPNIQIFGGESVKNYPRWGHFSLRRLLPPRLLAQTNGADWTRSARRAVILLSADAAVILCAARKSAGPEKALVDLAGRKQVFELLEARERSRLEPFTVETDALEHVAQLLRAFSRIPVAAESR